MAKELDFNWNYEHETYQDNNRMLHKNDWILTQEQMCVGEYSISPSKCMMNERAQIYHARRMLSDDFDNLQF